MERNSIFGREQIHSINSIGQSRHVKEYTTRGDNRLEFMHLAYTYHIHSGSFTCSRFTRVTSFKIGNSLEDVWNTSCRKFTNTKIDNIIIDITS